MEAHLAEMEEGHEEDTRGGYTRDKLDADVLQAMCNYHTVCAHMT